VQVGATMCSTCRYCDKAYVHTVDMDKIIQLYFQLEDLGVTVIKPLISGGHYAVLVSVSCGIQGVIQTTIIARGSPFQFPAM
jgi:hypothetical protein